MWKILSIFLLIRVCCHLASVSAFWKYCSRKNAAHFGSTKPGKTPASAHAGPISPFFLGTVLPKCILEVLFPENVAASKAYRGRVWVRWPNFTFFIFPGTVLPKCILEVLFPEKTIWKYCSRKKRFGSTVPGKNVLEVLFPEKTRVQKSPRLASLKVKRILEVLFPEKRALSAGERSRWPNFTFFYFYFSGDSTSIFPATVLPK